ncbi:PaaX family transcriptional regulator [Paracoccus caeni]|uniref:PaaX family transcriptional regulator n=1 Tax=Paracoccus caeni TaxID=657651 RepID=A0A934SG94_9RHOB|nr:PaaX family transcriptional regulator C-terminal domain-containing protein [Paracoccus caeni]MBK4216461.1 PaaX family transcriptional regulator [Paracoccus caeni]
MPRTPLIGTLTEDLTLTAGSFIVTIYGDIVVPRGEVLWMGSLIEICARLDISENLVRTAVSRLVSADRLEGERVGRRSYYRLAPSARAEFADAARLLYAPRDRANKWLLVFDADLPEDQARRARMAKVAPGLWISPDRADLPATHAPILRAEPVAGIDRLSELARFWDMDELHSRYRAMLDRFRPLADRLDDITPEDALIARLLLVHVYRSVVLRDPGLPEAALPEDWPGTEAQRLFRQLYLALSSNADRQIAAMMEGEAGPLSATTDRTTARLAALTT